MHHDQPELFLGIQGWFNIPKATSVVQNINKLKKEKLCHQLSRHRKSNGPNSTFMPEERKIQPMRNRREFSQSDKVHLKKLQLLSYLM